MKFKSPTNESSTIEGAHFDDATGVLTVRFKSGHTYHYQGCKQDHYDGLCSAESPGKYLHREIRGSFKHRKSGEKAA